MARDALDPGPLDENGDPTFPNAPRLPDGEIDWDAMGGVPEQHVHRAPDGRRHRIKTRPTTRHPVTGELIDPE